MDQGHSIFRLTPIGYTRTGLPIWPMRGGADGGAQRSELPTPSSDAAFKEHLGAAPPDGHGDPMAADLSTDDLRALHDEKHATAAEHYHPGGMVSGRSELSDGSFLVRTMPPVFTYDDGESVRAADIRDDGEEASGPGYLTGRFAVFDTWTEVRSAIEGNFMERTGDSAFRKTLSEGRPPILFQHGWDGEIGTRPIAPTEEIGTDGRGGFYGGRLLAGVPELVVSGLRAGLYGSSYRFRAVKPEVTVRPRPSDYNPRGIPEVTVREAILKEIGPGMFPVYVGTTAKVRSQTDDYLLSRFGDPEQLRSFIVAHGGPIALEDEGAGTPHSADASRNDPPRDEPPTQPSRFRSRDEWLDYLKERQYR